MVHPATEQFLTRMVHTGWRYAKLVSLYMIGAACFAGYVIFLLGISG